MRAGDLLRDRGADLAFFPVYVSWRLVGSSTGRPHSLRSWRLPDLLFLSGTSDDHDRLGTRRSSSARKCSSRRAAHHAPRTEGWRKATPQTTPTARRFAPPPTPSGGGQCRMIGPAGGIGKYPSGLCMGSQGPLGCEASVQIAVTPRGRPRYQTPKDQSDVPKRAARVRKLARQRGR